MYVNDDGEQPVASERHAPLPITIFSDKLSALETIVKYLKEQGRSFTAIATLLDRSPSTITTTYHHAQAKHPELLPQTPGTLAIPLSVIRYRKLATLETIVMYLRHYEHLTFNAIATHLKRDGRVIWTVHKRATEKITPKKFLDDLTSRIQQEQHTISSEDKKRLLDLKHQLQEKYGLTDQELENIMATTATPHLPITIFTQQLPPLQATTKYLHEQEQLPLKRVAELLDKPQAQIATAYHHAKQQAWNITNTPYHLPVTAITKHQHTIMACVAHELTKTHHLTNQETARLLHKRKHSIDRWLRQYEKKEGATQHE